MIDFEVTWDLKTVDAETRLLMDRRHELLEDGEWIQFARRTVGRDDLYVYRHREHGTYVLVQMLWWEPRIASEIQVLPGHPDRGGGLPRRVLLAICKYEAELMEETRRDMMRIRDARKRSAQEDIDAQKEAVRHHLRHGRETMADAIGTGSYVQPEKRSPELQELASELSSKAKGRVVTGGGV